MSGEAGCDGRRDANTLGMLVVCHVLTIYLLTPYTDEEIDIQRGQVISLRSHSQKAQEAGCPFWSVYETCSQPSTPCGSRLNGRNRQHLPMVLEIRTVATFGEEGVVMERGYMGASGLPLDLGVLV